MNRIVIIGAGGHGRVVADIAKACGYNEIIFLDDTDTLLAKGKVSNFVEYKKDASFIVAIGNNQIREKIQNQLLKNECKVTTLVHPNAVLGSNVSIGTGTVVMAGVVINTGARIGDGAILNTSSSVDHDCIVEKYCHIAVGAHLAGTVHVGQYTWIGAGTTVSNNATICENCMIGAGTVVVKDIKEKGTYVGVPARKI